MIKYPPAITRALNMGAALAISISGGKDNQAIRNTLVATRNGSPGPVLSIYAHLGRMAWPQSHGICKMLTDRDSIDLVVVRKKPDLLEGIEARWKKLHGTGKPFWPDSSRRYCTSGWKRDEINKYLRNFDLVISAEGIRWEESRARAQGPAPSIRKRIASSKYRDLSIDAALKAKLSPGILL